jgi:hypothetical protein
MHDTPDSPGILSKTPLKIIIREVGGFCERKYPDQDFECETGGKGDLPVLRVGCNSRENREFFRCKPPDPSAIV